LVEELAHINFVVHAFNFFQNDIFHAKIQGLEFVSVVVDFFAQDLCALIEDRRILLLLDVLEQCLRVLISQDFLQVANHHLKSSNFDGLVVGIVCFIFISISKSLYLVLLQNLKCLEAVHQASLESLCINEIDSHFDQIFKFFLQFWPFFVMLFILLVLLICCFPLYFFKFLENFTFLIDTDRWQRLFEQLYRILLILEYLIVMTSWTRWSQELLHQVRKQIEEAHQLNFTLELLQILFS